MGKDGTIKILMTIRQGQTGGGETHVLDLVSTIDRSLYTPVVLSFTDGIMVEKLRAMDIETKVIHTETAFDFRVWKRVKKFIQKADIKLVHAHGTRANSNVFWAAKSLGLPIVYTVHGWSFHPDQKTWIRKARELGERFLTNQADITINVSESNQMDGIKRFNMKRSTVINYGINVNKFNPDGTYANIREEFGIADDYILVGYLVRITTQKDPVTMIKAAAEVLKHNSKMIFLFVGDGDLKSSTVNLAEELGIEKNIIFEDFRQDIPDLLSAVDIYCLPSLWEGLPIGMLEAMSMEKAVVASEVDGTKNALVQDENGVMFPPGQPKILADILLKLSQSQSLRTELGKNARKRIMEKHQLKKQTREIELVYQQVLQKNVELV